MSISTEFQLPLQKSVSQSPANNAEQVTHLSVGHVTDPEDVWQRQNEWTALLKRSHLNTPFQTPAWHKSWWNAFGSGHQLSFLFVEANESLVGIAPLLQSTLGWLGIAWKELYFLGSRVGSDYCDFIADKEHPTALPELLRWLATHSQEWNLIHLSKLRGDTGTVEAVVTYFQECGFDVDVRKQYEAPTRLLDDPVEDAKLPRKKSLKRHYNYFNREGELEFVNLTNFQEIEQHLEPFFEQHIARWGETDTPSQFLHERQRIFYKEMVQAAATDGWLLFSMVLFDGKAIAYHLGFDYAGTVTWYKPVYDVAYSKHSPGEVLLKHLLEYALEQAKDEFDFTIGSESYKYRYANLIRTTYEVRIYRNRLCSWVDRSRLSAIEAAKQSEFILGIGRKLYEKFYASR